MLSSTPTSTPGEIFSTPRTVTPTAPAKKWSANSIGDRREQFVLATKFSFNQRHGDPNGGGNHRKNMTQALHGSLKRLGTDYVDLYWMHAWDELTPIEEVMRAFDDFVRAGQGVCTSAFSDAPAWLGGAGQHAGRTARLDAQFVRACKIE